MGARRAGSGERRARRLHPAGTPLPAAQLASAADLPGGQGDQHRPRRRAALRRWTPVDGEVALRHAVKDSPLETKLTGTPLLHWLGLPNTVDSLRGELQQAGLPAVLLLHVVLGAALDKILANRAHVTVSIDQLVAAIGWEPRSREERLAMRAPGLALVALLDAMQVIGRRDGKWRDPDTHEMLDVTSRDALIRITGRRCPAADAFDESLRRSR